VTHIPKSALVTAALRHSALAEEIGAGTTATRGRRDVSIGKVTRQELSSMIIRTETPGRSLHPSGSLKRRIPVLLGKKMLNQVKGLRMKRRKSLRNMPRGILSPSSLKEHG
jgi:hypothetical protein